eukprot:TRINITY_DN9454_c0_g1_i1.p1 TRINITY_DN9454_c0_g1~~TRINITY_DN9454_c0_g1_i1.p1  ORF type:complete len:168 (-),score=31.31 TRINITY_DN9454_c0_g1_i1:28-531(-)
MNLAKFASFYRISTSQFPFQGKDWRSLFRKNIHTSNQIRHGDHEKFKDAETIDVHFILKDGSKLTVKGPLGMNVLDLAHKSNIELEGACEASLACSTCHVVVDDDHYDKIPEASDEENDMLDLAFGLTDTSRLGCQIILTKELDGMELKIPSATRNFAVDGFVPKPH